MRDRPRSTVRGHTPCQDFGRSYLHVNGHLLDASEFFPGMIRGLDSQRKELGSKEAEFDSLSNSSVETSGYYGGPRGTAGRDTVSVVSSWTLAMVGLIACQSMKSMKSCVETSGP